MPAPISARSPRADEQPEELPAARDARILIHAPYGRDALLIQQELRAAGLSASVCKSVQELCLSVGDGAGAALLADEALTPPAIDELTKCLRGQPPWSDFPLVVMTSGGATTSASRYRFQLLDPLANVTLLERPLRPETLISALRVALCARRRQYQVAGLLSELAANNRELKHTNEELTRVNRELEEFAFVASHDLQEPLRMINIYTQLVVKKASGDDKQLNQYAGFISQGVERMERLIRDLLTFSRSVHLEGGGGESADLSVSLAQALAVMSGRIEEDRAVIRAGALPTVRGDVQQLAQVFQNLISNSLKYRNKTGPPEIDITAHPRDDEWIIAVRDNGIGFNQQYAERIFGLFRRLHKDEYPGTGLGLAICRRIVEHYDGRMWATGEPDKGATFYFALPRA